MLRLSSFDNVIYDVGTNALLPTSNTVNSGTFFVNGNGVVADAINTGILNSIFSITGLTRRGRWKVNFGRNWLIGRAWRAW